MWLLDTDFVFCLFDKTFTQGSSLQRQRECLCPPQGPAAAAAITCILQCSSAGVRPCRATPSPWSITCLHWRQGSPAVAGRTARARWFLFLCVRASSGIPPALRGRLVPALSDRSRDTAPSSQAAAVPHSVRAQALVPSPYLCRACPAPRAAHLPPPPSGHRHSSRGSAQSRTQPPPSPALPLEQSTGRQPVPTLRVAPSHGGQSPAQTGSGAAGCCAAVGGQRQVPSRF